MKVTPYGHICHKLLHSPVYITNTLIIRCNFFRFIGRKPITCPSNNCLQIMVCHAQSRLGWGNSRHLATPPLFPPPNDVWETNAEILYWWRVTPQIWVVLLIGCAAWEIWFKQSEALPRSGDWRVISTEFLCSLAQTSFGGKTSGSVAKCRLFSQAKCRPTVLFLQIISGSCVNETTLFSFLQSLLREKWQIASLPKDVH